MNKAEQIAFMDSLTVEQRAKIAQIIRSAYIEGDYCCCDEDGGSVWQESVQDTLDSLAAYFEKYDPASVLEQ